MDKKGNLKSIIWNTLGMSFSSTISLILLIVVTRINGIENSGTFSFLFSFCLIIYTITLYGGRVYQVSDYKNQYKYNEYYSLKIVTSILSAIVLFTYLYIYKYSIDAIVISFLLLFVKMLDAFSDTIYGTFQKNGRLDLVGKSLTLRTVVSVLVFIIADYITKDIVFSVFLYSVSNLLIFILYDKYNEKKFEKQKLVFNKQIFQLMLSTKYIFLNNFITNILMNIPRFVVRSVYTTEELGYFGILIMIPTVLSLFGQFIVQPILISLTNAYSQKDRETFNKYLYICFKYLYVIVFLCSIAAYFLGPQVLKIMYGVDFEYYRVSLLFLIIGGAFNVLSYVISTALNVFRKMFFQTMVYIITLVISALAFYLFAINFSVKIIFVVYAIMMLIQFLMLYVYYLIVSKKIFCQEE